MVSMHQKEYDYLFKLVLIGDSGVGKSCLLLRFADDSFTDSYITTIGVDFRFRTVKIDDKIIKLQIWDTAGQERFRTITSAYYRGADGVVLVYDTTLQSSFDHIDDWISEVDRYTTDSSKILVGNKCDLVAQRAIEQSQGEKKSSELGIDFIEASAKNSTNVEDCFIRIAKRLLEKKSQSGAVPRIAHQNIQLCETNDNSTFSSILSTCCGR
ncbi:Ras family protein Rab-1A, putative [Cryptosporidium muris RN66]|uniref:Ras family protein Rab-1A, putative n=1 Tax=Cryptosporidium muris (strain RN66) TaxID=441375 RepID=B6ACV3_CRYMR|nr:Ras family protein Rab-1A, putative [Cryptosporidium muris RN66]EEA05957.1 Ras family protein Rab-1A, putative [Cryptosporidium muris RN66]|eukprot:XP_002140306.1 Ras family protein Rab-1A [Cryptosporidium muris RN66]